MSLDVKAERTGWRDEGLSLRHRWWGFDCPCVDIDFLLLEFDRGEPSALVEYKHENAREQVSGHPSYRALRKLCNCASIPFFGTRYADDYSWFRAVPLNHFAKEWLSEATEMSEQDWVELLYKIRGNEMPEGLFDEPYVVI